MNGSPHAGGGVEDVRVGEPLLAVVAAEEDDLVRGAHALRGAKVPGRDGVGSDGPGHASHRSPLPRRGIEHPRVAVLLPARPAAYHEELLVHGDRAVERARARPAHRRGRGPPPSPLLQREHHRLADEVARVQSAKDDDVLAVVDHRRGVAAAWGRGRLPVGERRLLPPHRG